MSNLGAECSILLIFSREVAAAAKKKGNAACLWFVLSGLWLKRSSLDTTIKNLPQLWKETTPYQLQNTQQFSFSLILHQMKTQVMNIIYFMTAMQSQVGGNRKRCPQSDWDQVLTLKCSAWPTQANHDKQVCLCDMDKLFLSLSIFLALYLISSTHWNVVTLFKRIHF